MLHQTENEERTYLNEVQGKLRAELEQINQKIDNYSKEILETKRYIYENLAQLDSAEKAANRTAVYDSVAFGEKAVREREKLEKLIQSPYFGRIDFIRTEEEQGNAFYI